MDRTINPVKRPSKKRRARNWKAWMILSGGRDTCPFCKHPMGEHLCSSGQPHFYRPATPDEAVDPFGKLYQHETEDGRKVLVKRVVVASRAEFITSFCSTCAAELDTHQALCYQRTLAKGEVVGMAERETPG